MYREHTENVQIMYSQRTQSVLQRMNGERAARECTLNVEERTENVQSLSSPNTRSLSYSGLINPWV